MHHCEAFVFRLTGKQQWLNSRELLVLKEIGTAYSLYLIKHTAAQVVTGPRMKMPFSDNDFVSYNKLPRTAKSMSKHRRTFTEWPTRNQVNTTRKCTCIVRPASLLHGCPSNRWPQGRMGTKTRGSLTSICITSTNPPLNIEWVILIKLCLHLSLI